MSGILTHEMAAGRRERLAGPDVFTEEGEYH